MSGPEKLFSFSTALMAGGASTRMGRDKAVLRLPGAKNLLWERQWQLLADLKPDRMLWSGAPRADLPQEGHVVRDVFPDAGPLAGISACLDYMGTDLLVVLAVDLPQMSGTFLRGLLARSSRNRGAVVQRADFFEPLAAVYPKNLAALAREHLTHGRYALQDFIRAALTQNAIGALPAEMKDEALFKNLNAPSDLPGPAASLEGNCPS